MMLPIVMEYNQECTGEKYREIARAMGVKGVDEMSQDEYRKAAIEAVKKLSVDVGIPTKLESIQRKIYDPQKKEPKNGKESPDHWPKNMDYSLKEV